MSLRIKCWEKGKCETLHEAEFATQEDIPDSSENVAD